MLKIIKVENAVLLVGRTPISTELAPDQFWSKLRAQICRFFNRSYSYRIISSFKLGLVETFSKFRIFDKKCILANFNVFQ